MGNIVDKYVLNFGRIRVAIKRRYELCKGIKLQKSKFGARYTNIFKKLGAGGDCAY